MSDRARNEQIRAHVKALATRTAAETAQLTRALRGRSWPGGDADRSIPTARIPLRHWRPDHPAPRPPLCGCASGYCVVCN